MIIKYLWRTEKNKHYKHITTDWEGWFLLGVFPLYIRIIGVRFDPSNKW